MSKVDQKRNWVTISNIDFVQTLLRITCLANRKSYVLIIYANACAKLTKAKLGQVEVGSNITQNHCLADRKSYVVIICANACEKLTKSKIR